MSGMRECPARARAQLKQRAGPRGQGEADGTQVTATCVGSWRFDSTSVVVGAQAGEKTDGHPKFWNCVLGRHH